ncbi:SOS response-associated peptidase [Georgenia sp. 10Sc9-8]|uniref:Abasic site processing protein n=1 Tax=Georgenia halotolerans TaxID=3028317 RepID=A0ABT5U0P8_9MICO|nr:SOS response-associated peptidase [Georgenia halotolerans]
MCGRYANFRRDTEIASAFEVQEIVGDDLEPSWNVAPMDPVRAVLERAPREDPGAAPARQLRTARWGLVPSWAKDPRSGARLINARSETVTDKPSFAKAAARRRCVVPAEGYYEWQKLAGGGKQPYFLHAKDTSRPLAFAGLYELWPDPSLSADDPERWRWTTTILTSPAADALGHVHDRMPVVVPPAMVGDWLDPSTTDHSTVRAMIRAMPEPALVPRPVGRAVGNVRNDGPHLIEPVTPAGEPPG